MTISIDPSQIPPGDFYQYLIGAVAPRPIAFVSTVDLNGTPNLAPYSFFNAFSSNPPIVGFSTVRRNGPVTEKDTYNNIQATGELVINTVSFAIARQMSLTSIAFPPSVNEFEMAGFTPLPSDLVQPYRVKESPVQMECRLERIIPLHEEDKGTSLILCRILRMHLHSDILTEKGRIDPYRADLIGRMGRQYYTRASGAAILEIVQAGQTDIIGFEGLPKAIRESRLLTGNQLAQLAGLRHWPAPAQVRLDDPAAIERQIGDLIDQNQLEAAAALAALFI